MRKNTPKLIRAILKFPLLTALLWCSVLSVAFSPKPVQPKLFININGIEKRGTLYVSVCTKPSEWSGKGRFTYTYEPKIDQNNLLEINDIPNGVYAVALYQDTNGNGKLDTNLLGIPKEPYAFSNNRIPLLSEPSFNECKFAFNQPIQKISITLLK